MARPQVCVRCGKWVPRSSRGMTVGEKQTRGVEERSSDREANKRRGGAKLRQGSKQEAWRSEAPTGKQTRGAEERQLRQGSKQEAWRSEAPTGKQTRGEEERSSDRETSTKMAGRFHIRPVEVFRAKRGKRDCAPAGQAAPAEPHRASDAGVSEMKISYPGTTSTCGSGSGASAS
jgi:hypothetical protein